VEDWAGRMGNSPTTNDARRHYTMSRIRSKGTAIEVMLRKALWHEGVRYRKNDRRFPGSPDIAIQNFQIAVFCDGEFWHGKDWDAMKPRLQSNRDFWVAKIERNMRRDHEVVRRLNALGWTVIRFWGNEIRKNLVGCVNEVKDAIFQAQLDAYDDVEGLEEPWAML
jgi:DNA mismatch endonuclease (patch repair protein)